MITANDLLQVISEIHQYSMVLMELKEAATFGISRSSDDKLNYFKVERRLDPAERKKLVRKVSGGEIPDSLQPLPVERFLQEIEGKKTRHIWLETGGAERKELGFLSISELNSFFRAQLRR